ncbi:MAG: cold shock domain-containing protein [Chloroflexi bacterium]|nr:cold shock domain-containing protein [Chloroflexota bacterium]
MATGTITRIVRDRGFGFIKPDGETDEVFFHSSVVEQPTFDELNEGQQVEFETEADPRQPQRSRAAHVRLASS